MLRKDVKGIVLLAGNVSPVDVYAHIPGVCEEKGVRFSRGVLYSCITVDPILLCAIARAPRHGRRTASFVDCVPDSAERRVRQGLRRGCRGTQDDATSRLRYHVTHSTYSVTVTFFMIYK